MSALLDEVIRGTEVKGQQSAGARAEAAAARLARARAAATAGRLMRALNPWSQALSLALSAADVLKEAQEARDRARSEDAFLPVPTDYYDVQNISGVGLFLSGAWNMGEATYGWRYGSGSGPSPGPISVVNPGDEAFFIKTLQFRGFAGAGLSVQSTTIRTANDITGKSGYGVNDHLIAEQYTWNPSNASDAADINQISETLIYPNEPAKAAPHQPDDIEDQNRKRDALRAEIEARERAKRAWRFDQPWRFDGGGGGGGWSGDGGDGGDQGGPKDKPPELPRVTDKPVKRPKIERERKIRVPPWKQQSIVKLLSGVTEACDAIEAVFNALPREVKRAERQRWVEREFKRGVRRPTKGMPCSQKLVSIYRNAKYLSPEGVVRELLWQQIEDYLYALRSQLLGNAARERNQLGPGGWTALQEDGWSNFRYDLERYEQLVTGRAEREAIQSNQMAVRDFAIAETKRRRQNWKAEVARRTAYRASARGYR